MAAAAWAAAAYRAAWRAAWPVISLLVRHKDARRGVLPGVTAERFGRSQRPGESRASDRSGRLTH